MSGRKIEREGERAGVERESGRESGGVERESGRAEESGRGRERERE